MVSGGKAKRLTAEKAVGLDEEAILFEAEDRLHL